MAEHPGSDALDEARAACAEGDFARALNRYSWFFDNCLSIDQSWYGVRLSYVLDEWAELGRKYPPAADALTAKQQATITGLRQTPSTEAYHDLVAICEYLGQPHVAVELFKELRKSHPAIAKRAVRVGREVLFKAGEYTLLAAYIPSASDRYAELLRLFDHSVEGHRLEYGDDYLHWARESFRNDVEMLVTILQSTGRVAEADDIGRRAANDKNERGIA